MAPVIKALENTSWAKLYTIDTAQHRELIDEMLTLFAITPNTDLNVMEPHQTLANLTAKLCHALDTLITKHTFDMLLAVGDTTTVLTAALCAFYRNIPFGHIEGGMRSYHKRAPFPEEMNRLLTSHLATLHFVPTVVEFENLLKENISPLNIFVTGNPVIDSLYWVAKKQRSRKTQLKLPKTNILVTMHRRESFGPPITHLCKAMLKLIDKYPKLEFIFPVHPNPEVQKRVFPLLSNTPQIHLTPPLNYEDFVYYLSHSYFVMTDSGGVQEEAPALKKPVLILRDITERPLIVSEGLGELVGTDKKNIIKHASALLDNKPYYQQMAKGISPYGDGHASTKIIEHIQAYFE